MVELLPENLHFKVLGRKVNYYGANNRNTRVFWTGSRSCGWTKVNFSYLGVTERFVSGGR